MDIWKSVMNESELERAAFERWFRQATSDERRSMEERGLMLAAKESLWEAWEESREYQRKLRPSVPEHYTKGEADDH